MAVWLLMLLSGAMSAGASVETIAQTEDYGLTDLGAADMPGLIFNKFNPSLGTLDDIVITLKANNSLESLILNLGSSTQFQKAKVNSTISVSGEFGVQTRERLNTVPFTSSIALGSFFRPVLVTGPSVQASSTGVSYVNPDDFSDFEGRGTLDYLLNATVSATASGSGGPWMFFGYKATSYGSVQIDYNYTPKIVSVPEAGTIMAGFFALGMGFLSVRRSRVRA